jgi:hypothetical protein
VEKPTPTPEHKKLERLSGTWIGEERIQGSPHTTEAKATGTFEFRQVLDRLFTTMDYVEKAGGKTLMAGHGVIGWDAKLKHHTLHWFDTFGSPPGAPGPGRWDGDTLTFHQEGSGNTVLQLADGDLVFRIEMDVDGRGMTPVIEGRYRRIGSSAVSEADQPERDSVNARS